MKPGALYVLRLHREAGYIIMPHAHPEDENIVVVKGSWAPTDWLVREHEADCSDCPDEAEKGRK
jgi:hypothetical protein